MRTIGYIASGVIVGSSLMIASSAIAGGFAIREQSTTSLGVAFADSAAGSDLSSMFWNPAAVTVEDGMNSLSSYTVIVPNTELNDVVADFGGGPGTVGTTMDTLGLLAGSYFNYQVSPKLYVGASINAPFGLVTEPNTKSWSGAAFNRKSEMLTFNVAPTVGYKISPMLSVAVGVQIQYVKARLSIGNPVTGLATDIVQKAEDIGFGFTAGLLLEPTPSTKIGVGFRSSISHDLSGVQFGHPGGATFNVDVSAGFDSPEIVTASIRQQVTPSLALMVNYEWANWSRLQDLTFISEGTGGAVGSEEFLWEDSYFISAGAEMNVSEALTVRAGLGYETSPVPEATRGARLPDSDRVWLALGGSYKWSDSMTLDFGYSHIFFEDSKIGLAVAGKGTLTANVENSADIISVGMRHKW